MLPRERRRSALKVMDFGIAKVMEAARATSTQSLGTLQYMSPEQIDARKAIVTRRSDLVRARSRSSTRRWPGFRSCSVRRRRASC